MLGRSLEARQRLRAARGLQRLFDVRPDQVSDLLTPKAVEHSRLLSAPLVCPARRLAGHLSI